MSLVDTYLTKIGGIVQDESAWLPDQVKSWPDEDIERIVKVMMAIAIRASGQDKGRLLTAMTQGDQNEDSNPTAS